MELIPINTVERSGPIEPTNYYNEKQPIMITTINVTNNLVRIAMKFARARGFPYKLYTNFVVVSSALKVLRDKCT